MAAAPAAAPRAVISLRDTDSDPRWLNVDLQAALQDFARYHDDTDNAPPAYARLVESLDRFADSHMDRHRHVEITEDIHSVPHVGHDHMDCLTRGRYTRTDIEQTAFEEYTHGNEPSVHELPLRIHVELSSVFAMQARNPEFKATPPDRVYNLFDIQTKVIVDRFEAAMALLWETNNATLARQERNCMLAIVPIMARHVKANPTDHKIDPDAVVGAMTLVPAYNWSLHEFASPYRMLSAEPRVSCAHIPHTVLVRIAGEMLQQLYKIHDKERVIGNIGPHSIAYLPDKKSADALHTLTSDPLHRSRNDSYTEHAMSMIRPGGTAWEWNFVGFESSSSSSERPVHYYAHTVSPFFAIRPNDLHTLPCAQEYFRVINMLNDYEALVHTLANVGRSYHDKRRLQGIEEAVDYTPDRASRYHLWFAKLSMAYYPPWCSAMLQRIDNERECLLHMPPSQVSSWTPRSLVTQLTHVLDSGTFGPLHRNDYVLRDCCDEEFENFDTSVSRHLDYVAEDPTADEAAAWTVAHGDERTDTGHLLYQIMMQRVKQWIPDWENVSEAVVKLHNTYMYVPGTTTSTLLPKVIQIPGFDVNIADHKSWVVPVIRDYFGNKSELEVAHNYAYRLQITYINISRNDFVLQNLSPAQLAQLIATAEETMQVLVDAIDSSDYNIDDVAFRTYLLVLAVDEALHRLVTQVLRLRGDSLLCAARAIINDERCVHHAHDPMPIQFASDQLARLCALTLMRLKCNTHSRSAQRLLQDSDTSLNWEQERPLLQKHMELIANTIHHRLKQLYVRHPSDHEKEFLEHEQTVRRHIGKMIDPETDMYARNLQLSDNPFRSFVAAIHDSEAVPAEADTVEETAPEVTEPTTQPEEQ